jgi:hypothetical protein
VGKDWRKGRASELQTRYISTPHLVSKGMGSGMTVGRLGGRNVLFICWYWLKEVCLGGCGVFIVSVWCVLPVWEYEESGRWGVGFQFVGGDYGMFHSSPDACAVVFEICGIAPVGGKGGVATARGPNRRVKRVVGVGA